MGATVKPSTLRCEKDLTTLTRLWKNGKIMLAVEEKNSFRFVDNRKNQFTTYQLSMYVYEEVCSCIEFPILFFWKVLLINFDDN